MIQSKSHTRDRSTALDSLQSELEERLQGKANDFLQTIRCEKTRYARDQFRIIQSLLDQYGVAELLEAIDFCQYSKIFSANTLKDYLNHKSSLNGNTTPAAPSLSILPVADAKYHVTTQKRPLAVYAKMGVR